MSEWIVFLDNRPEFLYDTDCTVIETYQFGEIGSAAYLDCDDTAETTLRDDDRVVAIEPNITIELPLEPDHVSDDADAIATIEDVRRLHDVPADGVAGKSITVVAMDSGVDPTHSVFNGTTIEQVDVTGAGNGDQVGHGTAVLGQITRLAPEADLIALRIFGTEGQTQTNVIMRAYEWLYAHTDRYDIVNMSWGSQDRSAVIDRTHNGLVEKGIRDVVSAGNSGGRAGSPATAARAFSVAACTEDGRLAEFSSYNPERDNPDVTAIGKNNRLAQATGTTLGQELPGPWIKASGTSFSAPEVAGMVAKYLTLYPDASPRRIMVDFEAAARNIPATPSDGAGLADYRATIICRRTDPAPTPAPVPEPDLNPTSTTALVQSLVEHTLIYLDEDWLADGEYAVTRQTDNDQRTVIVFERVSENTRRFE
jgi:subtilisin family serine protease